MSNPTSTNEEKQELLTFSNIKKFVLDHITLYTIILIFIGYWNLHSYYMFFGINIYNYVTTTEILLSFIPIILKLIIILLFLIIMYYMFHGFDKLMNLLPGQKKYEKKKEEEKKLPISERYEILKRTYKGGIIMRILILTLFAAAWWDLITFNYPKHYFTIFYILLFYQTAKDTYLEYNVIYKHKFVNKKNYRIGHTILVVFLFLYILFYENYTEAKLVLNCKPNYEFKFNIDSTVFHSDSTLVYVGETQSYLILRNNYTGYNSIFKKENIKDLQIKKFKEDFFLDEFILNGKAKRSK